MRFSPHARLFPVTLGLVGASLLCLGTAASAQQHSYQVVNDTLSGGGTAFPVTDDLTFTNLHLTDTFADGFSSAVTLRDFTGAGQSTLDTGVLELNSGLFTYPNPQHGALKSAALTGDLTISGLLPNPDGTLTLTLQPTLDPASQYVQEVLTNFSATLFGAAPTTGGVGVGEFSAVDASNNVLATTGIYATAVPEPGAFAVLGAGVLALLPFARRRRSAA